MRKQSQISVVVVVIVELPQVKESVELVLSRIKIHPFIITPLCQSGFMLPVIPEASV